MDIERLDPTGGDPGEDRGELVCSARIRRQVDHRPPDLPTEDHLVDVAHQRLLAVARRQPASALNSRNTADERTDLGITQLSLRRKLAEKRVLRLADQPAVEVATAPLIAADELLRRLPGSKHVELRMPVQI